MYVWLLALWFFNILSSSEISLQLVFKYDLMLQNGIGRSGFRVANLGKEAVYLFSET